MSEGWTAKIWREIRAANWLATYPYILVIMAGSLFASAVHYGEADNPAYAQTDQPAVQQQVESSDDRLADYTLALAAFTAALVVVSGFQLWFLRRADETARTTAEAAKANAQAAQSQAEATILVQRPWIKAEIIENSQFRWSESHLMMDFKVKLTNVGNTPATAVRTWVSLAFSRTDLDFGTAKQKIPVFGGPGGHVIFPNDFIPETVTNATARKDLYAIPPLVEGSENYFLVVAICYARYQFPGGVGETMTSYVISTPQRRAGQIEPVNLSNVGSPGTPVVAGKVPIISVAT